MICDKLQQFYIFRISTIEDKTVESDWALNIDKVETFKKPYIIKNHLPASFLPRKIWEVKPKVCSEKINEPNVDQNTSVKLKTENDFFDQKKSI